MTKIKILFSKIWIFYASSSHSKNRKKYLTSWKNKEPGSLHDKNKEPVPEKNKEVSLLEQKFEVSIPEKKKVDAMSHLEGTENVESLSKTNKEVFISNNFFFFF